MLVTVRCEITLTQTEPQKILYHSDKFILPQRIRNLHRRKSFFEEQDPALDRLARDFAQHLVASINRKLLAPSAQA